MKANAETPDSSGAADTMKWVVAFVLLAAALLWVITCMVNCLL